MSHFGFTFPVAVIPGVSAVDRKMMFSVKVLPFQELFLSPFLCLVPAKTFFHPLPCGLLWCGGRSSFSCLVC